MLLFIYYYVKGQSLYSREWCDLVFENRNKEYGAYALRRDAGRRYRLVATVIGSVLLALTVLLAITGFFVYQAVKVKIAEVEEELQQMKPLDKKDEPKAVSAGRRAVKNRTSKATEKAPEMVEEAVVPSAPLGIFGPDDIEIVDAEEMVDKDLKHNTDQQDLPVEGVQLLQTDVVEEMPAFPGGLEALMRFMDDHVIYPQAAINKKLEGDVEVAFIIDKEGNLIEPEIVKKLHPLLDDAVMQAIKKMPKWKPGKSGGKPIVAKVCIPVHFQVR